MGNQNNSWKPTISSQQLFSAKYICLYLLMCHQVPHNAVWPRDPKRENVCPRPNFRAAKLSANVYWLRHLLSLILFRFVFVHWCRSLWSGKHNMFNFNKSCMNLKSQVNVGGNYYFFTKQVRCKFAVTEVMPALWSISASLVRFQWLKNSIC